jgi:hypothetical protein
MPEPHAGIQGTTYYRKLLRQQWRTEHVACGSPTASIIRNSATPTSAGRPAAGLAPTYTAESGLSDLNVAVEARGIYDVQNRTPDFVGLRENERIFHFMDVPATSGVAAGTLLASDTISFEGRRWAIKSVENDTLTGLSSCRAELVVR